MFSQHPNVLHRLREEILNKVGSSRRPTYDDLRDMKYMRAVINGESYTKSTPVVEMTGEFQKHFDSSHLCEYRVRSPYFSRSDWISAIYLGRSTSGKYCFGLVEFHYVHYGNG
jgi:hypothetical protein